MSGGVRKSATMLAKLRMVTLETTTKQYMKICAEILDVGEVRGLNHSQLVALLTTSQQNLPLQARSGIYERPITSSSNTTQPQAPIHSPDGYPIQQQAAFPIPQKPPTIPQPSQAFHTTISRHAVPHFEPLLVGRRESQDNSLARELQIQAKEISMLRAVVAGVRAEQEEKSQAWNNRPHLNQANYSQSQIPAAEDRHSLGNGDLITAEPLIDIRPNFQAAQSLSISSAQQGVIDNSQLAYLMPATPTSQRISYPYATPRHSASPFSGAAQRSGSIDYGSFTGAQPSKMTHQDATQANTEPLESSPQSDTGVYVHRRCSSCGGLSPTAQMPTHNLGPAPSLFPPSALSARQRQRVDYEQSSGSLAMRLQTIPGTPKTPLIEENYRRPFVSSPGNQEPLQSPFVPLQESRARALSPFEEASRNAAFANGLPTPGRTPASQERRLRFVDDPDDNVPLSPLLDCIT